MLGNTVSLTESSSAFLPTAPWLGEVASLLLWNIEAFRRLGPQANSPSLLCEVEQRSSAAVFRSERVLPELGALGLHPACFFFISTLRLRLEPILWSLRRWMDSEMIMSDSTTALFACLLQKRPSKARLTRPIRVPLLISSVAFNELLGDIPLADEGSSKLGTARSSLLVGIQTVEFPTHALK